MNELSKGKVVIIWSHPSDKLCDNPFSRGDHYILAADITQEGKIFIANSSSSADIKNGIQFTDSETLEKIIFEDTIITDHTWGRYDFTKGCAYVVVG